MLQFNCCSSPRLRSIGVEESSILIWDEFLSNTSPLIDFACERAKFAPDHVTQFPGVRAAFDLEYAEAVLDTVEPAMREVYPQIRGTHRELKLAFFSLVSTQEDMLKLEQRLPHVDTINNRYFAIVLYLNEGDFGGTGFFRHSLTKFEYLTQDRIGVYSQSVNAYMATRGLPAAKYTHRTFGQYELYDQIDYRSNRLALYPGNMLHSGLIDANRDVSSDPRSGRLTVNIFVEFCEAK